MATSPSGQSVQDIANNLFATLDRALEDEMDRELNQEIDRIMDSNISAKFDSLLPATVRESGQASFRKENARCARLSSSISKIQTQFARKDTTRKVPDLDSQGRKYCRFVLKNEKCPHGTKCRYRHLARDATGSAVQTPHCTSVDKTVDDAFTCPVCHDVFVDPVTLPCGHTFDRSCLEKMMARDGAEFTCPLDRKCIQTPLPAITYALRDIVAAKYPAQFARRMQDLNVTRADEAMTDSRNEPSRRFPCLAESKYMRGTAAAAFVLVFTGLLNLVFYMG